MFFRKTKLIKLYEEELTQIKLELKRNTNHNNVLLQEKLEEINQYKSEIERIRQINELLVSKYSRFIEHDEAFEHEKRKLDELVQNRIDLNEHYQQNLLIYKQLEDEVRVFQNTITLQECGIYESSYSFENSIKFKEALIENKEKQKKLIIEGRALILKFYSTDEIINVDSLDKYEKSKYVDIKNLLLYAINTGCDSIISKVRWDNVFISKERIYTHIKRIVKYSMGLHYFNETLKNKSAYWHVSDDFVKLKFQELNLTYEYSQKKIEEKEEQKRIREQIREEEKALRDYEKAEREAEEEEKYLQKVLEKVKQKFGYLPPSEVDALNAKVKELETQIKEAQEKKARAIALAQTTKVGYIYVISNIGSLGDDIYKIGMTRRLDPQDRVDELSNASVPFRFDVHAVIFSENAPQLEYDLHQRFNDRRLNRVNRRKEFFKVKLEEIEEFVKEHADAEIEFTKIAEAREYRETMTVLKQLDNNITHKVTESKFPNSLLE